MCEPRFRLWLHGLAACSTSFRWSTAGETIRYISWGAATPLGAAIPRAAATLRRSHGRPRHQWAAAIPWVAERIWASRSHVLPRSHGLRMPHGRPRCPMGGREPMGDAVGGRCGMGVAASWAVGFPWAHGRRRPHWVAGRRPHGLRLVLEWTTAIPRSRAFGLHYSSDSTVVRGGRQQRYIRPGSARGCANDEAMCCQDLRADVRTIPAPHTPRRANPFIDLLQGSPEPSHARRPKGWSWPRPPWAPGDSPQAIPTAPRGCRPLVARQGALEVAHRPSRGRGLRHREHRRLDVDELPLGGPLLHQRLPDRRRHRARGQVAVLSAREGGGRCLGGARRPRCGRTVPCGDGRAPGRGPAGACCAGAFALPAQWWPATGSWPGGSLPRAGRRLGRRLYGLRFLQVGQRLLSARPPGCSAMRRGTQCPARNAVAARVRARTAHICSFTSLGGVREGGVWMSMTLRALGVPGGQRRP